MGKKKRQHPDLEEVLARPWCYYCERDFDDLKILISHQKSKHFKCERCGRRLNTAGGLSVHMNQVHKEQMGTVDNALPDRENLDYEIFGMEGIPEDVLQAHNQKLMQTYYEAQANRQAVTGNPPPGAQPGAGAAAKRPKFESPAELKKRLADHRARKAAGELTEESTPAATPTTATTSTGSILSQSELSTPVGTPSQPDFPLSPLNHPYQSAHFNPQMFPHGYGQSSGPPPFNSQHPGFPPIPGHPLPAGLPMFPGRPFPPPPQFLAPNSAFPPGMPPIPPHMMMQAPPNGFPPSLPPHNLRQTSGNFGNQSGHNSRGPSHMMNLPSKPPGSMMMPHIPGLPQRPQHSGLPSFAHTPASSSGGPAILTKFNGLVPSSTTDRVTVSASTAASVDAFISSVAEEDPIPGAVPALSTTTKSNGKKDKDKSKDRPTKLVYTDNEVSPEEKMAKWSKFASCVPRFQV